jgi:hypothetical protein
MRVSQDYITFPRFATVSYSLNIQFITIPSNIYFSYLSFTSSMSLLNDYSWSVLSSGNNKSLSDVDLVCDKDKFHYSYTNTRPIPLKFLNCLRFNKGNSKDTNESAYLSEFITQHLIKYELPDEIQSARAQLTPLNKSSSSLLRRRAGIKRCISADSSFDQQNLL